MKHLAYLYFLFALNSWGQSPIKNSKSPQSIEKGNFVLPQKNNTKPTISTVENLKKTVLNSPLMQGFKYQINIKQLETLIPIQQLNEFVNKQNKSLFNSSFLKNSPTNVNIKGIVRINGVTQVITLKGLLNNSSSNFNLQISYHVATPNMNLISKIIEQPYQNGLALKLKINLDTKN